MTVAGNRAWLLLRKQKEAVEKTWTHTHTHTLCKWCGGSCCASVENAAAAAGEHIHGHVISRNRRKCSGPHYRLLPANGFLPLTHTKALWAREACWANCGPKDRKEDERSARFAGENIVCLLDETLKTGDKWTTTTTRKGTNKAAIFQFSSILSSLFLNQFVWTWRGV